MHGRIIDHAGNIIYNSIFSIDYRVPVDHIGLAASFYRKKLLLIMKRASGTARAVTDGMVDVGHEFGRKLP
jgi:hypothetical protein